MRISDWSSDVCSSDLQRARSMGIDLDRRLRLPGQTRRFRRAETRLQRIGHLAEILGLANDRVTLRIAGDILRTGLQRGLEHFVGAGRVGRIDDLADLIEHEENRIRLAQIADRKSTRSELQSLMRISYAVFCLNKKNNKQTNRHKKPQ